MEIQLSAVGKRYGLAWIFRHLDFEFSIGNSYALTGHNGSGKSTLLKIISGGLSPSEGRVVFKDTHREYSQIEVAQHLSYAAPYISLIDEFTLREMLDFHFSFKKMRVPKEDFLEILGLKAHINKPISNFSSGMMQRLKLCLAILSQTQILLLDEPTSYLDENAIKWYKQLLAENIENRLVILGSNQQQEYTFVTGGILHLPDFKYERKLPYGTEL
ncbi:MAG: ATP-binding cassette domain-containing protein [Chitinophagales bacterium]|nr:ATP-binding cassette domain-containing protein [Chitinophagales bacterium]MCZ2392797.1 ATP-binding cassette domain-containing protein [Chitinophagales bacterium]